jgi:hypothetical protein
MLCGVYSVVGQAEYDDMYFTSKDRVEQVAVVKKEKPQNALNALTETSAAYQAVSPNISMEGYTGRTINPDYQPGGVSVVTTSYFTPNYQPTRVNSQLYTSSGNNFNNFNNYSSFMSPYSFYGGRYGFGNNYSPYGYGYDNWGYSPYAYSGFYNPYYSNWGYSPYGYGNSISMLYGMNYGYGGGLYGYGCPTSYYGYYPGTVVVVNNPDNHVNTAYGKRQSRSTYVNNTGNSGARGSMLTATADPNQNRGGRVASTSTSNSYYQRGWRQDPSITQSSSSTSGSRYSGFSSGTSNTRSGWSTFGDNNNTRSSWGNSSFSGTNRSNTNSSFSGGTRSSGSSFSGGSSTGGSRSSGGSSSSSGSRGRGN